MSSNKLKKENSITVFSVSQDGKLEATRPVTLILSPNNANLTMIQKPQHVSAFLSAERIQLPTNYSTADHHPKIKQILNQGLCGSCWACSTTSVLTDMFVVAGYDYFWLDVIPTLTCTWQSNKYTHNGFPSKGCRGGYPWIAFLFLSIKGTIKDKNYTNLLHWTKTYTNSDANKVLLYNSGCNLNGKYFAKKDSIKSCVIVNDDGKVNKDATVQTMKKMILKLGGIVSKYNVFLDFQVYSKNLGANLWKATKGVYIHNIHNSLYKGQQLSNGKDPVLTPDGGHAVALMGWGTMKNCPYGKKKWKNRL